MKLPAPDLARNPISIIGSALVTLSAILFLFVYLLDLFGMHTNPYIGIVFFLVMPGIFIFGLLLIPAGMWREHRARLAGKTPETKWPIINLNNPRTLRIALVVAVLTIVNVLIVGLAAFRGIEYMDSVTFCGQTCHEVMQPEFASYQASPHARVRCVECHIGSGASWFVKSKISGARQLYAVAFNTHSRPIPSPVTDLRPARDTCEQCHWPEKFHGDKIRAFREYAPDQTNTESVTVMRIHVGGGSESLGRVKGIHWHTSRSNVIEYIATDDKRQVIPYVRLTTPDGRVKEFVAAGVSAEALAKGEHRRMDCMDCHNRPSHQFPASAERAVDLAIARGEIDQSLPFVRREGVRLLKASYADQPTAFAAIRTEVEKFYAQAPGDVLKTKKASVDRTIDALQRLFGRSVFPSMKVTWGSYPTNLGHNDFPGCFRCHDDSHKAKDGTAISQDCELCHTLEDIPASEAQSAN